MKVVVVNGAPRSGKDEFMNMCVNYVNENYSDKYKAEHISIIDSIKFIAKNIGWNGVKDERGRKLLNDLKVALEEYDNIPIKKLCELIDTRSDNTILLVCCRNPKDIDLIREKYNASTIYISRDSLKSIPNNLDDLASIAPYIYGRYLLNNGTLEDLRYEAEDYMEYIIKER